MGTHHGDDRNIESNRHRMGMHRAALVLLVLICACAEKGPIQIGFLGGLSGRVADLGISGRDGALLAVEQRNAKGGIGGRPVKLVVKDDTHAPDTAKSAVRELLAIGVPAIIGPTTSSMAMAVVPLVNQSSSLLVAPTVTTTDLTGIDDRFLRVSSTTEEYAHKAARHLVEKEGVKSATLVFDLGNEAYTRSWMANFSEEFLRLGGAVAGEVTFLSGPQVSLLDVAQRAADQAAEAVVISAGAMDAAMLCQQFAKLGGTRRIAVSEWAATERFLDLGGPTVEGVLVDQFFDRDGSSPSFVSFVEAYRARYSAEPGFAAVSAYDAANLVMDALAAQRSGEDLKLTILRLKTIDGVQGPLTLDAFGESDRGTHLSVVRDGAFRPLE